MATTLIGTYELSSIFENLFVINLNLVFLKSLSIAEDKIDKLDEVLPRE